MGSQMGSRLKDDWVTTKSVLIDTANKAALNDVRLTLLTTVLIIPHTGAATG